MFFHLSLVGAVLVGLVLGLARPVAAEYVAIDLHPAGFAFSIAHGVSGDQQVGRGQVTIGREHALLWSGSAANIVDLQPLGFIDSAAFAVSGGQQVGRGIAPGQGNHALLWSGSAASVVDLHPPGFLSSLAVGISGDQQVGSGLKDGHGHALLWSGSAASVVDLNPFLPPGFTDASATSIDANGNIVGQAFSFATGNHAFLWQPVAVAEPGSLALVSLGVAGLSVLRLRRHPKKWRYS